MEKNVVAKKLEILVTCRNCNYQYPVELGLEDAGVWLRSLQKGYGIGQISKITPSLNYEEQRLLQQRLCSECA